MQSTLKNMILVLVVITMVASAAVGGVYMLTKEPIAAAKLQKTNSAIADVMPEFNNDPSSDAFTADADGVEVKIYPAKMDDAVVGYAIETYSNNGFGGKLSLLVGFTPEGAITKVSVLEHKETPGLGDKIDPAKSDFGLQFQGIDPSAAKMSVKKDGGDFDAITASTITSRAYLDALSRAYETFKAIN